MKILGIDTGTNSLGLAIRDTNKQGNQIVKSMVVTFKTGVERGKNGEFSYAAQRTKYRSIRRLYQARKYRLWATLEVLIANSMCPLTIDELNGWRKYVKGKQRQYPVVERFEQWIRLDFNGDRVPDYISPYQLRDELATKQINLEGEIERYKLGRALYHIAQRRGFKSSKGDTINDNMEDNDDDDEITLKKSEEKKSTKINEYIEQRKSVGVELYTLGSVLADIENNGKRVREEWTGAAIRQQYEDEIKYIFKFQNGLDINSDFYKQIHTAIFYKRPLRSQKGLVGKCTFEPSKSRCPINHPDYEIFRAWSLLNNIKYKYVDDDFNEWKKLDIDKKKYIFDKLFLRVKNNFKFSDIVKEINNKEKAPQNALKFNYRNDTNVPGCPVIARLKKLLGEDWQNEKIKAINSKGKNILINWEDIWHIWFSADDEEFVNEYAKNILKLDDRKCKEFIRGWSKIPVGYANLSLKAIKNINRFLVDDEFIYSEAVLLAKIPEIVGEKLWNENETMFISKVRSIISHNRLDKHITNIVNTLISDYKRLELEEKRTYHSINYRLSENDREKIVKTIYETIGENKFLEYSPLEQEEIKFKIDNLYQNFFSTSRREYYPIPKIFDELKKYLKDNFQELTEKQIDKLYHPSMIDIYPEVKNKQDIDGNIVFQLQSPKTGSFKNPMAMRALYELRKIINYLLRQGDIDEDTRVVVELSRDLNDSNRRKAIEEYQADRAAANQEFEIAITELLKDPDFSGKADPSNKSDIEKVRLLSEQIDTESCEMTDDNNKVKKQDEKSKYYRLPIFIQKLIKEKDLINKYRLWKEQKFRCIYTGKFINIADLFDDTKIDFEHTIPRSISFDNSLANKTVCYAEYNRDIKKNKIPYQLNDYEKILDRIKPWKEKIESLESKIEDWKRKSKTATTKADKDKAIVERHYYQMELDYWRDKVERFEIKEVTSGFRHSQLVDNQLISKYVYHYLKSVFQKVSIQKGIVTAEFRKIYGIQEKEEKKDRKLHSHHAKDAAVLTLIPSSAEREKILKRKL